LLLESYPVGNREVYDRVRRQIIRRYLGDDRGLTHASADVRVPRFLLNDLTRYWRTVTVDFVYKQVAENDKKWALRNAKLRMSRKLIFAAGLAHVFFCHLDPLAASARSALMKSRDVSLLTAYLEQELALSPLEVIAKRALICQSATRQPGTSLTATTGFLVFSTTKPSARSWRRPGRTMTCEIRSPGRRFEP